MCGEWRSRYWPWRWFSGWPWRRGSLRPRTWVVAAASAEAPVLAVVLDSVEVLGSVEEVVRVVGLVEGLAMVGGLAVGLEVGRVEVLV